MSAFFLCAREGREEEKEGHPLLMLLQRTWEALESYIRLRADPLTIISGLSPHISYAEAYFGARSARAIHTKISSIFKTSLKLTATRFRRRRWLEIARMPFKI